MINKETNTQEFYSFSAKDIKGNLIEMASFAGKTVLVVNTASKCGLTPQYEGLENIFKKYADQNFVILGFPCNQFGEQEPGDESSIQQGCLINYGVSFPMFSKIDVNGENAHPLFVYLKTELSGFLTDSIKWNFTKFLISSDGKPLKRFAPTDSPDLIEDYLISEKLVK
jgi:glutathione peroxidase